MATRIYAINPGEDNTDVRENVGPTATSAIVAVTVDLATSVTGQGGTARTVSLTEVLNALDELKAYILRDNSWPPA